jgi:GH15 family glucan-1,4-alpha-glucosidase
LRERIGHVPAYLPIRDYAVIGDCRTAALISGNGSIDWLCWPRFDSPACFNRLLDSERGGYCAVSPLGPFTARRAYEGNTPVLVTEFLAERGRVRLTDLMPVVPDAPSSGRLTAFRHLLRRAECLDGTVDLTVVVRMKPDDGRAAAQFESRRHVGYCATMGGATLIVGTGASLSSGPGILHGTVRVRKGESLILWLTYDEEAPTVYPCVALADRAVDETVAYWERWAAECRYAGPGRAKVVRSALTLKLLTYAPSGAMVAAPTTSLPERLGGDLNWDYRYCWLRDASFAAGAFFRLGLHREASAFVQWLTHATTLTYPKLQVMYDVHGEASLPEKILDHLSGYWRSRPVRVGNAASSQFQLDIYGELLDGLTAYADAGHRFDRETRRWIVRMADTVARLWPLPDHGIWEMRGAPRHYVHSKVWCWIALERAERLVRRMGWPVSTSGWTQAREVIRRVVLRRGYSRVRRSFVQVLDSTKVDAAALTFSWGGFIPGRDPRMSATITTVERVLSDRGLVYRYRADGDPGLREAAFLPCSFWLAEALATAGRVDEAHAQLERCEAAANDLGLYAEEARPEDGTALGNFPLALTHVAHLNARLRLAATGAGWEARRQERCSYK